MAASSNSSAVLLAGWCKTRTRAGGNRNQLLVRAAALTTREEDRLSSRRRLEESWSTPKDASLLPNPLARMHRLSSNWLALIVEWEGVLVEAEEGEDLGRRVWWALAQEEGRRLPPAQVLRRVEGMKSEQAMAEILCWSRDPIELKRMARRREALLFENSKQQWVPEATSRDFLRLVKSYNVPVAVASTRSRHFLELRGGIPGGIQFDELVSADDVQRGKPDPEMFVYAAHRLGHAPEKCLVLGSSNASIEAAHEACMKCVAVSRTKPFYELSAADRVVRHLTELSILDLKKLADVDLAPEFQPQTETSDD